MRESQTARQLAEALTVRPEPLHSQPAATDSQNNRSVFEGSDWEEVRPKPGPRLNLAR